VQDQLSPNPQTESTTNENLTPDARCHWHPGATVNDAANANLNQFWCDVYTYVTELVTQEEARELVASPAWRSRADDGAIDRIAALLPCVIERIDPSMATAIDDLTRFAIEARARDDFQRRGVSLVSVDGRLRLYRWLDLPSVASDDRSG